MTTKEFIEKAIKGGFDSGTMYKKYFRCIKCPYSGVVENAEYKFNYCPLCGDCINTNTRDNIRGEHEIFLDPLAWQAVGKVEGWKEHDHSNPVWQKSSEKGELILMDKWENNMHRMVDALCEGKSIEQFLETL